MAKNSKCVITIESVNEIMELSYQELQTIYTAVGFRQLQLEHDSNMEGPKYEIAKCHSRLKTKIANIMREM
jgi:hypothetical protein